MSYFRPGVEVRQVQQTFSPTLIGPTLQAVVIGQAYKVVDLDTYDYEATYAGSSLEVPILGLGSGLTLDAKSVYIRLSVGNRVITSWVDDPVGSGETPVFTLAGSAITIAAGLEDGLEGTEGTFTGAKVEIAYRALKTDIANFLTVESINEIEDKIGKVSSLNPLGLGTFLALVNANTAVNAATIKNANWDDTTAHGNARDVLSTKEVYAMAPLTGNTDVLAAYDSHAVAYSQPTEKRERINIGTPWITWLDSAGASTETLSEVDKTKTAIGIRNIPQGIALRRAIRIFPDYGYIREVRHVCTVSPDFLLEVWNEKDHIGGLAAKLVNNLRIDGVTYYSGTEIDDNLYAALKASGRQTVEVMVPIPGFFFSAVVAGQVAGFDPEQGHTNMPTSGISKVQFASEYFSESQLNTVASGGNYIMWQMSPNSTIASRHQLTTDMSSIETRELNIIKSVDYVAKFVRNVFAPLIGRYNITPEFLEFLAFTFNALATHLKRIGRVNDLILKEIKQDPDQPDTVLVALEVLPKYPVNYIRVDLIF